MSASVRVNSAPSSPRAEQPQDGTVADLPCRVIAERTRTELEPVHNKVIPDELLVSLTSTVCSENALKPSAHQRHCKGCTFRRPDAVWHHPLGRKKYKHFMEQPTSLTGAGRDISFLCDAVQRKAITLPPLSEKAADSQNMTVLESLIPEEYHIVKNKGLRDLELYEDAFTVQLQDDEQKLRVFPSMKPSGRQEVLQLMRVMDDMLEKAGVESQRKELNQLSQIEGLLDLVRTEQNIYNVVFHELIRQVSVGCIERGQLLAKLRQRYQSLLERIPLHLKALHTEAVAQRALDRQLTVEIHRIKTSIQQLSRELARIKAHDAFVSQQAERAQHELANALGQSQNNAEVVQRYHELYELQRSRLNSQMLQMAEERDLWSQFTYGLALKLIRVKDLQLIDQLHSCEMTWHQTAESSSIYITTMDNEDLKCLSDIAAFWREELETFMSSLRKRDHAQSQHVCPIQQGVAKWQAFCTSQQQNHVQKCPKASMEEIHTDVKAWTEALAVLRECFQGEEVLAHREAVESLVTVRDRWQDLCLQLLRRHSSPENAPSQHYQTFTELQILLSGLSEQLNDHITGENGLHSQLQSLSESIEPWLIKLANLNEQSHKAPVLDLKKLETSLAVWQSVMDKIFCLISGVQTEGQTSEPVLYTETTEAANKVKLFVETLSSFVDAENQTTSREIMSVHMARTRWMLDLLLLLVPDLEDHRSDRQKTPHLDNISVRQLENDTGLLGQKVDLYSTYFIRTTQLIYEEQVLRNPMQKGLAEQQMMESRKLESEGTDWMDTSTILLASLKMAPLEALAAVGPAEDTWENTASDSVVNNTHPLDNPEAQETFETEKSEERTEHEPEQREPSVHNSPVLEVIASDRSIIEKELGGSRVQLTGSEELAVAPVTEEAQKAFTELNTMTVLHQELQESEEQVQSAQQRALKAEEALQAALQKIQDLERQLQGRSSLEPKEITDEPNKPEPSESAPPVAKGAPVKKSTTDSKPSTSSRKTRKR